MIFDSDNRDEVVQQYLHLLLKDNVRGDIVSLVSAFIEDIKKVQKEIKKNKEDQHD